MTEVPYSDGRTGGGRYFQDPTTGLLTKEEPVQPSEQALPEPVVEDANGEAPVSEKKGTK